MPSPVCRRCMPSRSIKSAATAYLFVSTASMAAAGWWSPGGERAGQPFFPPPSEAGGDEENVALRALEQKQFWGEVERVGLETLEDEVVEKKRGQLIAGVAKACSVGAQITFIMGVGGLLFRLLPVLLGHDVENEEIDEAKSSLLLQPGTGRRPQALSAVKSRFFLMDGDAAGGAPARQGAEGNGAVVTARRGELVEGGPEDCEVVVFEERRAILGKVRRLSRPFLRAMALSLAALLAARLFLGDLLAARIDPTIELLFSDDVVNTYAEKVDIPDDDDPLPFSQDADDVPGRKKMKGRSVQRPPRPEGGHG
ncbi:unnamed protein product [Ascophyllum nodosum]